jgi:hypothetical protein
MDYLLLWVFAWFFSNPIIVVTIGTLALGLGLLAFFTRVFQA